MIEPNKKKFILSLTKFNKRNIVCNLKINWCFFKIGMKSLGLTQSYMYISGLTVTTAFLNFIMLYTLHGNAYSQKVNYHRLLITVHTESTLTKRRHFWGRLGFMTKVETWLNANKCEMGTFSRKQLSKIGRDFEMAREGFGIKCLKMLSVELFTVRTVASMSKFCFSFALVWFSDWFDITVKNFKIHDAPKD